MPAQRAHWRGPAPSWFAEYLDDPAPVDELTCEMVTLNTALNARLGLRRVTADLDPGTRRGLADLVPLEDAG